MFRQTESIERKGRGRPRKGDNSVKSATGNYFNDFEENIVLYNSLNPVTQQMERDKLFKEKMYFPLWYMSQTILRRYFRSRGFPINESDEELIISAMSFVVGIIEKFDVERGCKAYSYIQTVLKHFFEAQFRQHYKYNFRQEVTGETIQKMYGIDEVKDLTNKELAEPDESDNNNIVSKIISNTILDINHAIEHKEEYDLNDNDCHVGNAIINLLINHEEILGTISGPTNKFNKSIIVYSISDSTLLNHKVIKASIKKYKEIYKASKKSLLSRLNDDE